jgi:glycosyltransferase involved in cell wall biosynthesis
VKSEGGWRARGITGYFPAIRPLISIVTVVFNGEKHLAQTIDSVLRQTSHCVEYIVVDGGSSDGTVDILRRYEGQIGYWVSEPDTGIYNAMNKGWELSRGEYIYYLGADDVLLSLPIPSLRRACDAGIEIVYGDVHLSDGRTFKSRYGWELLFNNTLHHQGLFLKRTICPRSPFDEHYRVFSDFDLNQRLYARKAHALFVKGPIARFSVDGVSNDRASSREFFQVIGNNFGPFAMGIAYLLARFRGLTLVVRRWIALT